MLSAFLATRYCTCSLSDLLTGPQAIPSSDTEKPTSVAPVKRGGVHTFKQWNENHSDCGSTVIIITGGNNRASFITVDTELNIYYSNY